MWDKVKNIIGTAAPIAGSLLRGPAGGAVGTLIASALGVEDSPEAIEKELLKNPEALLKIKALEHEERSELRKMVLEQRRIELEKYETAHSTYKEKSAMADHIASSIIKFNLPVIFLLVVGNIIVVYAFKDNAPLIAIVSNIIGISTGMLFQERQAIINSS